MELEPIEKPEGLHRATHGLHLMIAHDSGVC